jgi:hypothetical protein
MADATLVVPPAYEAQLFGQGYCAAQISARKVTLVKFGEAKGPSRFYNKFQAVAQMSFAELVQFVLNQGPKQ